MGNDQREDGAINIMILADTLTIGGAEQLLLELLRGLNRQRFKVTLSLLGDPGIVGHEIEALGIECISGIAPRRFDVRAIWRLRRIFKEHKPDILLLINHRNCLFFGIPAARLSLIPAIINWQNETSKRYSLHRLTMACRRLLLQNASMIIAAARGHKDYIVAAEGVAPEKITVIYNGVDPSKFICALSPTEAKNRLGIKPQYPVVGIVAALRPDKAHEIFLAAAAKVRSVLPTAQFLVVGDGPQREFLERTAAELKISDAIHFLGFRRDTPEVLRSMDVFCLSSRPQQETLSVAALEAMASGLPVVATRVGFLHEIVFNDTTGYLVPVDNPQALADSISLLLTNTSQRISMGENARALVERTFSLQQMVTSFEELFSRAVQPPHTRRHVCVE